MSLVPDAGGLLTVAPRDFPTNKGGLCQKGWTAADLLTHPDRLTTPLMRDGKAGALRPVSWDVALDRIAWEIAGCRSSTAGTPSGCSAAAA